MTSRTVNFKTVRGFTVIEVLVAALVSAGAVVTLLVTVGESAQRISDALDYRLANRLATNLHELVLTVPDSLLNDPPVAGNDACAQPEHCTLQLWFAGLLDDFEQQAAEHLPNGNATLTNRGDGLFVEIRWTARDGSEQTLLLDPAGS
jgi:hypothetical protein